MNAEQVKVGRRVRILRGTGKGEIAVFGSNKVVDGSAYCCHDVLPYNANDYKEHLSEWGVEKQFMDKKFLRFSLSRLCCDVKNNET
jgi:hypothetical protein